MAREQILHEALEEIANPIAAMQRRAAAEGKRLDGMGCVALSKDPGYLSTLAQGAIDKARKLVPGVTFGLDEVTAMCRNIGYDISCGRCASVFFTNMAMEDHDPECKNRAPEPATATTAVDPASMLLVQIDALLRDLEPEDNGEGACSDPNAVLNIVGEARRLIREFNKR